MRSDCCPPLENPVEGSGTEPSEENGDGEQPWRGTFCGQLNLQHVSTELVVGRNVQGLYQLL